MSKWFSAIKGGIQYAEAVIAGDLASDSDIARRLGPGGCGDCPHKQASPIKPTIRKIINAVTGDLVPEEAEWCGEPYVGPAPLCGCEVHIRTAIASKQCPLDDPRWGPVEPNPAAHNVGGAANV